MHGFHLVGWVLGAGPRQADVKLITTRGQTLGATIIPPTQGQPTRATKVWLEIRDDGRAFWTKVANDKQIARGDLVHLED